MSGPAVFPVSSETIRQVAQSTKPPIIEWEVDSAEAAIEMMIAGASCDWSWDQFHRSHACPTIIEDLPQVMDRYGIDTLRTSETCKTENLL